MPLLLNIWVQLRVPSDYAGIHTSVTYEQTGREVTITTNKGAIQFNLCSAYISSAGMFGELISLMEYVEQPDGKASCVKKASIGPRKCDEDINLKQMLDSIMLEFRNFPVSARLKNNKKRFKRSKRYKRSKRSKRKKTKRSKRKK